MGVALGFSKIARISLLIARALGSGTSSVSASTSVMEISNNVAKVSGSSASMATAAGFPAIPRNFRILANRYWLSMGSVSLAALMAWL